MRSRGLITIALILAVVFAVGCSKKQTYVVPGGKMTVNEKGGNAESFEVKTDEGTANIEVKKKSISEAELGVPVYPGAVVEVSGDYQESDADKGESYQHHILTTPDDFDKVSKFYQSKLKGVKNSVNQIMGDVKMAIYEIETDDGTPISLHIMADKDKNQTTIQVVRTQKPKD